MASTFYCQLGIGITLKYFIIYPLFVWIGSAKSTDLDDPGPKIDEKSDFIGIQPWQPQSFMNSEVYNNVVQQRSLPSIGFLW